MNKQISFILLIVFILCSCEDVTDRETMDQSLVIYHNSFESKEDTENWKGNASLQLKAEAPDVGGKQSVFISGGCIIPHAYLELGPVETDGLYILRFWGKNLTTGGSLELGSTDNDSNIIQIRIVQKNWKKYISEDTLFCAAGEKLRISMNAGGFLVSSMLVDMLEIVKVNSQ
ncbi:MAG: hypothetical protein V3S48_05380 [Candidatus Neomarinimicrobiota bacterium]